MMGTILYETHRSDKIRSENYIYSGMTIVRAKFNMNCYGSSILRDYLIFHL